MVVDLRNQQVKDQEQFETNVDNFVTELKTQIDDQSNENINKFEEWFSQRYNNVVDITEVTYEEVQDIVVEEEEEPDVIMYATKSAKVAKEANYSAYVGYGILSMGVVLASATYLYKKRQAKQVVIDNSALLENEDF